VKLLLSVASSWAYFTFLRVLAVNVRDEYSQRVFIHSETSI